MAVVSTSGCVSKVAYDLSDAVFLYPATNQGFIGEEVEVWGKTGQVNASKKAVVVKKQEIMGSGSALNGAASVGLNVSAIGASPALLNMLPDLYNMTSKRLGCVFHVSVGRPTLTRDSGLLLSFDYSDIYAVRNTGACLLASAADVQENHDIAIIAHLAAKKLSKPVVHFFDGAYALNQSVTGVNLLDLEQIEVQKMLSNIPRTNTTVDQIEAIMKQSESLLGYCYRPFEFIGDHQAELVIVVLAAGSLPIVAEETLQYLFARNMLAAKAGVVKVRLLRPWSRTALLAALPPTTKQIAILELRDSLLNLQEGSFHRDVASSLLGTSVKITYGSLYDVRDIRPNLIKAVYDHLSMDKCRHFTVGLEETSELSIGPELSITDKQTNEYLLWSSTSPEEISSAFENLELGDFHLQVQRIYDRYQIPKEVVTTQLRFGKNTIRAPYDVAQVETGICLDEEVFFKYNVLQSIKDGGSILVVVSDQQQFGTNLTNSLKREILARQIQIYAATVESNKAFLFAVKNLLSVENGTSNCRAFGSTLPISVSATESIADETGPSNLEFATIYSFSSKALEPRKHSTPREDLAKHFRVEWALTFPEAFDYSSRRYPDESNTYTIYASTNRRLTPLSYDRNVFHIEFDLGSSGMKYDIGDALGVYGHNDPQEVAEFLEFYRLDPTQIIAVPLKDKRAPKGKVQQRTIAQVFTQYLDIFGRPSKRFYEAMGDLATDPAEKEVLSYLCSPAGNNEFKRRVAETINFVDLLKEFPSFHPSVEELVKLIPPIKPRHYSIASSNNVHPDSVHLLVVTVEWITPSGKSRKGLCTRYLEQLKPGQPVTVSIKPSVMHLPTKPETPVVMAGLGTGMAPFRAFIEERAFQKAQGHSVGPLVLYFGSRFRNMEYLYGEELEAYHEEDTNGNGRLLTHLRLAFSRDQREKVYIQHKIAEDESLLTDLLVNRHGHFYLCGPTWPAGDVYDAIVAGFSNTKSIPLTTAKELIANMKEHERYVLEVY